MLLDIKSVLILLVFYLQAVSIQANRFNESLDLIDTRRFDHDFKMGLFSSSTAPVQKISADGTRIAPDRSERAKCWEARDGYFACLDKNNIVDSITEKDKAAKACSTEAKGFETNCAASWVR